LVCGSMAFDTIMVFQDQFKNHILPDHIHILNVSFLVPEMRREFGGCAGNIAYGLKLLGGNPRILATVGEDDGPYRSRLSQYGLDQSGVKTLPGTYTAQCFITTDHDDNQITAFHPGAMGRSHENHARDVMAGVSLGIVGPDGRDGMMQNVQELADAKVPFIFDPGQALPILSGEDLLKSLELATWCTVNDYELQLVCNKTGLSVDQIAARLDALIVTLGAQGSRIYAGNQVIEVAAARVDAVVDPTGCGDAYRGGLLYGIAQGWSLGKSARLASVMGALKIAQRGPQTYQPSRDEIAARFAETFGERPW
ncbi:MAG: carbohydrate kinase family protein, partial [Moraxellaceae bacterium]|nr:carbohydrate kinase family protein [Moraxellaceae bacterium]